MPARQSSEVEAARRRCRGRVASRVPTSTMMPIGLVERQAADQHRVDQREHRGVDADAERQGRDRDGA